MGLALVMRRTLEVSAVWDPADNVVQPRLKVELRVPNWSATAVTSRCDERHTLSIETGIAGAKLVGLDNTVTQEAALRRD